YAPNRTMIGATSGRVTGMIPNHSAEINDSRSRTRTRLIPSSAVTVPLRPVERKGTRWNMPASPPREQYMPHFERGTTPPGQFLKGSWGGPSVGARTKGAGGDLGGGFQEIRWKARGAPQRGAARRVPARRSCQACVR